MERRGFILIADITGYTVYLSRSELEHAQGTLTDLLEVLVDHTRPPLVISALEGDAVFSYALGDDLLSGQTFVEGIEDAYVAFRRTIELMTLNNTCRCNACANVSSLDLKFFLHHGSFVVQSVGGRHQLVGSDINLLHRLLKNRVTERTGIRAYILCTEAAERALGLDGLSSEMHPHRETVDGFGEVDVWIRDMHPFYEERRRQEDPPYAPHEVIGHAETQIAMPPQLVWDYLNQSEFRNVLFASDSFEITDRQMGRVGAGTTIQCYHGDSIVPQTVVRWEPFDRVVLQQTLPLPGRPAQLLGDLKLEEVDGGTRLRSIVARPTGPWHKRMLMRAMMKLQKRKSQQEIEAFRDEIEADLARRQSADVPLLPSREEMRRQAVASLGGNG